MTFIVAAKNHFKRERLADHHGVEAMTTVFDSISEAIVSMLILAEDSFHRYWAEITSGGELPSNCFQLLGVDVILNSTLHPKVNTLFSNSTHSIMCVNSRSSIQGLPIILRMRLILYNTFCRMQDCSYLV